MTSRNDRSLSAGLILLEALMLGPLSAKDAAGLAKYPFEDRAAERQLECLERCLPWVVRAGSRPKRWEVQRAMGSSSRRAVALATARALLPFLRGTAMGEDLDSLLLEACGGRGVGGLEHGRVFYARNGWDRSRQGSPKTTEVVLRAVSESKRIRTKYRHFSGRESSATIEPLTVLVKDGELYLYATVLMPGGNEHRIMNVHRMFDVVMGEDRCLYPTTAEYSPDRIFGHCWGVFLPRDVGESDPEQVVLEFPLSWKSYLASHKLHSAQVGEAVETLTSVSVTLRLFVTWDLVHWVRGHGNQIHVREPTVLREWVKSGEGPDFGNSNAHPR